MGFKNSFLFLKYVCTMYIHIQYRSQWAKKKELNSANYGTWLFTSVVNKRSPLLLTFLYIAMTSLG